MDKARLVVLASGFGSNLQAVMDACAEGRLPAQVVAVVSDRKAAYALERARQAGIASLYHPWAPYKREGRSREDYDADLAALVAVYRPDLVVLAGWLRVLSRAFLDRFPGRVINLHPALPGSFPGLHAIERAYEAFQRGEINHTGVMVHYVPDEGVDSGPVILQEVVPICPDDTLETLTERVHAVEHRVLVEAIRRVLKTLGEQEVV